MGISVVVLSSNTAWLRSSHVCYVVAGSGPFRGVVDRPSAVILLSHFSSVVVVLSDGFAVTLPSDILVMSW